MATQTDKIRRLEDELKMLDKKLTYYGELFNEDSDIDKKEKAKLAKMQAVIKKAEAKLTKIKKKQISNRDKKFAPARDLITKLENVFIEANLKETSYQKLQDYSMDISDISNRIKAEGVLEPKHQRIVDELDSWDNRIHEEIEKKVKLIRRKEEKEKEEKPFTVIETPVQVNLESFSIQPEVDILIKSSNGEKIKRSITDIYNNDTIFLPKGTTGDILVELKFTLFHGDSIIETFERYETISTHYESDSNGNISINELKMCSNFNRSNIVKSIIDQIKAIIKAGPESKNLEADLKKLITKVNQQTIVIETNNQLKNNTIVLQAEASVDDTNLDLGASALTVLSIDYSTMLFKGFKLSMQIPIILKTKKTKKETNKSDIKFNKNQVKLDNEDIKQLQSLIINDFTSLVEAKLKKDFSHKQFNRDEIDLIRDLTLKETNKTFYLIHIKGTTSCSGDEKTNIKIAKSRQDNVKAFLTKIGVPDSNFISSPIIGKLECTKYIGKSSDQEKNPREVKITIILVKLKLPTE